MGPVVGVGMGADGRALTGAGRATSVQDATNSGATSRIANPSAFATMPAAGNVFSQVGQMLESIGGGVQNDQLLRMMIALLILQALLENSSGGGDQATNPLDVLNNMQSGSVAGLYASSTSIEIQQTMTTSISMESTSVAAFGLGDASAQQGGTIDFSV